MSYNVLVTVCPNEEWIEILKNLEQKWDWKIRYMVGLPEMEETARNSFNGILFESIVDFLTGLECFGKDLVESNEISALPEKPFEFDLLEKLSKYEFMTKYMIDRDNKNGSDRTNEIYFDLINYWLKIIDFTKPSLIIVPWTPYTSREYVLYALSQIYGIKFLSFRSASIGYYLNIPFSNPHASHYEEVVLEYEHLKAISPSPLKITDCKIQKYAMQRIQEIMDLNNKILLNNNEKKLQSSVNLNKIALIGNHCLNSLNIIIVEGNVRLSNYFFNMFSIKKSMNFLFHNFKILTKKMWTDYINLNIKLKGAKKLKLLKLEYDAHCIEPDYNCQYILFTLHFQPEQSTAPFGNYAVYQYLPIEMIARSLPDNWVLYVKEHYATFSTDGQWGTKRTKEYYERISKIPNVVLIPIESPTAVLIDHSKAVATITGSVGHEGILRGKPVLTFGFAWYNGCEGVFHIQNHNECKEIIEKIRNGITVDPNQMLLFVQATETVSAKVHYDIYKEMGDQTITREETIINMTECISEWWGKLERR